MLPFCFCLQLIFYDRTQTFTGMQGSDGLIGTLHPVEVVGNKVINI